MAVLRQTKSTMEGELHNNPPWPEWSDAILNSTQWNRPLKHSTGVGASSPVVKSKTVAEVEPLFTLFEDPAGLVEMPPMSPSLTWERPQHIDPDLTYVLEPDPTPLDLTTHNKHLLDCEMMRAIIVGVACLEREASYRPFPIEFQSDQFQATDEIEWKPWHHVYALTMAGSGQPHNPQYNPYGKYIVRLFFVGKWRRIYVDDRLPVDADGRILLPMSRPDNLWLPLLAKALMKIACLSWVGTNHCVDFTVIHCLTGWIATNVPSKGCSTNLLWCVCCQMMEETEDVVKKQGCCRSADNLTSPLDEMAGQSATGSRVLLATFTPKEHPVPCGVTEHTALVTGVAYNSDQLTPLWKLYRWNDWASRKGIISDTPYKPQKNIHIYNPLVNYPDLSGEVSDAPKNDLWLDFEEFAKSLRSFEVYYKPSYFKYSVRAWSEQELLLPTHVAEDIVSKPGKGASTKEKGGGDAKSNKTAKTVKPDKSAASSKGASSTGKGKKGKGADDEVKEEWPKNLRHASFFYCLIDSMSSKGMLCSLSVWSPEHYAIIFIGKFEWYSPSVAPITNRMATLATSARYFILPPGLQKYRIWHNFPAVFCMQMFSNTYFQFGTKMFIQQSLTCDSLSFKYYGKEIVSSFEQLMAAPQGGASHGGAYQQMMGSLEPPHLRDQLPWPQWFQAHTQLTEAFEASLTEMLVESIHHPEELNQTIQAYQLLFLNPVFGMKTLKAIKPEHYTYVMEQKELQRQKQLQHDQEFREQIALAHDQKGKKGSKGKTPAHSPKSEATTKPAKSEKPDAKKDKKDKNKPKSITEGEQLRKLIQCKEKNLLINDQHQAIVLIKKMVSKVPHLRYLYPFNLEEDMKLVFKDYTGEIHAPDDWIVIVRCVMNTHSTEPTPCSVHIWSPVEDLVLRLINNDSNEEILPLGFVENNVAYLSRNKGGYTVMAYGMTEQNNVVGWRLRSMGLHETNCLHICKREVDACANSHVQPPEQAQMSLHGYYVPNKNNVIANCLLEVSSDVTALLRFHLSYKYASCRLTITDEAGQVVCDSCGTGNVMLPTLHLTRKDSGSMYDELSASGSEASEVRQRKPQVYKVTVTLLKKSWPLQPAQMKAMLYYKENLPHILNRLPGRKLEERSETLQVKKVSQSSQKKQRSSTLRTSTKLSEDPDEKYFDDISDKPSWTFTLVTDLQEEMPVSLRMDMSIYEQLDERKKKWREEGFDLSDSGQRRQEFLSQFIEETGGELSEEDVFKLKPKKLLELTKLYGRKMEDVAKPSSAITDAARSASAVTFAERSSSALDSTRPSIALDSTRPSALGSARPLSRIDSFRQPGAPDLARQSSARLQPGKATSAGSMSIKGSGPSSVSTLPRLPSRRASAPPSQASSVVSTVKSLKKSEEKLQHSKVLVEQAEIHKALSNIREKTLEHIQQIFKETSELREKIINEMKMAKEAELGNKQDLKKGKKSKEAEDNKGKKSKESAEGKKGKKSRESSPDGTKARKDSPKGGKKEKGAKGKKGK